MSSRYGDEEGTVRPGHLRLVPPVGGGQKTETPSPELKRVLDEMRRLSADLNHEEVDSGGKDAA